MQLLGYRLQSCTNQNLYLVHTGTVARPTVDWTSNERLAHLFTEGQAHITLESLRNAGLCVTPVPVYEREGDYEYVNLLDADQFIPEGQ